MITSLGEHGVLASDLAPSLITTQKIENPDYDPLAAQEKEEREAEEAAKQAEQHVEAQEPDQSGQDISTSAASPKGEAEEVSTDAITEQPAQQNAPVTSTDGPDPEEEGDIGAPAIDPITTEDHGAIPSSSPSASPSNQAPCEAEDGDIATLGEENKPAQTSDEPDPSPPSSTTGEPAAATAQEPQTILADPNSAAQVAAASANIAAGNAGDTPATNLGLASEPQTVEPPPSALPGVTTELSTTDTHITLDLRWTILCDLFLVLTADSVYDARSRVLLERVAEQLGLTWMDVTKFEKRVTDALEIEEGAEKLKDNTAILRRQAEAKRKKWAMVGLATVGGGLVIGLSAGLAAPLVGAGLAGFLGTVGIGGTSSFLAGVGGAAVITTTGTLGGAAIGGKGMARRTQSVRTFQFKPIHNNKRVNCIVTVPGFMNGEQDDVRLPFSVIDSIMGDVFSVLWEPDMMREMGNALYILYSETLVMGVQSVLAVTVAGGLLGALAWPLWLTKLGYLIDNPWSNALTRAEAAGKILADILARRQLGVRPITLVGFSLGARAIFYALLELAKKKAFGVVQNVYIFGTPVSANDKTWREARSVAAGRFVNGFSRTDWILGYLHRATSGGLRSIAGLHPVERVADVENVDVTTSVPGHLQYRAFMPLVMSEVGFRVTQDWFDEPEDLSKLDREGILEDLQAQRDEDDQDLMKTIKTKTGGLGKIFRRGEGSDSNNGSASNSADVSRPGTPTAAKLPETVKGQRPVPEYDDDDDDLPPREEHAPAPSSPTVKEPIAGAPSLKEPAPEVAPATPEIDRPPSVSAHVDTDAVLAELRESGIEVKELQSSLPALSLIGAAKAKAAAPESIAVTPKQTEGPSSAPPLSPSRPSTTASSRPSLKSSVSSFFSSRTRRATHEPSPLSPKVDKPVLSVPGGTYTLSGAPSPSAAAIPRDPKQIINPPAAAAAAAAESSQKQESGPSTPTRAQDWDKPFSSAATTSRDLPLLPPAYAPAHNVDLSFASDFDDDETTSSEGPRLPTKDTPQKLDESVARGYGMSTEAARELALQFAGGSGSKSATTKAAPPPMEPSAWGASSLNLNNDAQEDSQAGVETSSSAGLGTPILSIPEDDGSSAWGNNAAGPGSSTPIRHEATAPSAAAAATPPVLQPLQTSYMGAGRRLTEEEVDAQVNRRRSSHRSSLGGGSGSGSAGQSTDSSYPEAGDNPWQ